MLLCPFFLYLVYIIFLMWSLLTHKEYNVLLLFVFTINRWFHLLHVVKKMFTCYVRNLLELEWLILWALIFMLFSYQTRKRRWFYCIFFYCFRSYFLQLGIALPCISDMILFFAITRFHYGIRKQAIPKMDLSAGIITWSASR